MRKNIKSIMALALSAAMVLSLGSAAGIASAEDTTTGDSTTATDAATDGAISGGYTYNAYLGYQAPCPDDAPDLGWDYRNEQDKDLNSTDYNYLTQVNNSNSGARDAEITNAVISQDGTYTVSIAGNDISAFAKMNMLFISTDIPVVMPGVKFTDVHVSFDGTEIAVLDEAPQKYDNYNSYMAMVINAYGTSKDTPAAFEYTMPKDSISVTFTVSGVDYTTSYKEQVVGLKKNATKTVSGVKYKVTTAGKVSVVGLAKKTATSVKVPDSIKVDGVTYKVSSLEKNAFKGASKLKSATLGKNITKIPAGAFVNCKKLTTVKFSAKLTSVAKDSFKGCKKVKVTGTSAAANKKALAKKNAKVTFK